MQCMYVFLHADHWLLDAPNHYAGGELENSQRVLKQKVDGEIKPGRRKTILTCPRVGCHPPTPYSI